MSERVTYRDGAIRGRQPGEAGVAEGVAAGQEAGYLVTLQAKLLLAHPAF